MKARQWLWSLGLLWSSGRAVAQGSMLPAVPMLPGFSAAELAGQRAVNEPRKLTFYVTGRTVSEVPAAGSQKIELSFRDSVSGTIRYYYASGKLSRVCSYAHIPRRIRHGVETTWSEDGHLLTRQEFRAGLQQGEFLAYFSDGTVERKIVFDHDQMLTIQCFGRQGEPKNCYTNDVPPVYPGGLEATSSDLAKAIVYPQVDEHDHRGGRVLVTFTVDTTGALRSPQVRSSPSQTLQEAVLQGVARLKPFRKPAQQEGKTVAVTMALMVNFEVKKSGKGVVHVAPYPMVSFPMFSQQK